MLQDLYSSDGLRVVGYLVRPRDGSRRRYPVIIYNRGGFLDRGKIDAWNIVDFEHLSAEGFVASWLHSIEAMMVAKAMRNLVAPIWMT
jgi:hypothetical protein